MTRRRDESSPFRETPEVLELLAEGGAGCKVLEEALISMERFGSTDPDLEALAASLRTLRVHAQPETRAIGRHLVVRLLAQNKKPKLLEAAAELGVAAWLAHHRVLTAPPDFDGVTDAVLDLGARLQGGVVGVEVKRDEAPLTDQLLLGVRDGDPLALLPILRRRFGEDASVGVSWDPYQPSPEEWCRHRIGVVDQIRPKVEATTKVPTADQKLVIRADLATLDISTRFLSVTVSRGFQVSIETRFGGDGWGSVAERIFDHGTDKSLKTEHPFLLAYYSTPGSQRVVTPDRLPWAWEEVAPRLPETLLGVIVVRQDPEDRTWVTSGVFRDEYRYVADRLGVELIRAAPQPELAEAVWARLQAEAAELAQAGSDEWAHVSTFLAKVGCDNPAAGDLLAKAVVLASRDGRRLDVAGRYRAMDLPFPCDPKTLCTPRVSRPRR